MTILTRARSLLLQGKTTALRVMDDEKNKNNRNI